VELTGARERRELLSGAITVWRRASGSITSRQFS
jgi:hypothetical protein